MSITVTVTELISNVTVTNNEIIATTITSIGNARYLAFAPHGTITATNVQGALEQLADQQFVQDEEPSTATEGDLWYDTGGDQLMVYREVSPETLEWRVLALAGGNVPVNGVYDYTTVDMESLDGGNY